MLKKYFPRTILSFAAFNKRHMLVLFLLMFICFGLYEFNEHIVSDELFKRFVIPTSIIAIAILPLIMAVEALLLRLENVVYQDKPARSNDLLLVISIYIYAIGVFGSLFLATQELLKQNVFKSSEGPLVLEVIDAIYISGITIATVGYGDLTPLHPAVKFMAIAESILGLGLTAIVAGFFIGSLLGRQQQDRELRWFEGFQRHFLSTLAHYRDVLVSLDDLKTEDFNSLLQDLLRTVKTIIIEYESAMSTDVSVNWMQLYERKDCPEQLLELAKQFVPLQLRDEKAEATFWGVLVLRDWNDKPQQMPEGWQFALPVFPASSLHQLPGAPRAVMNSEGYSVVLDTQTLDLKGTADEVRQKIVRHFSDHASELRSFISIRMQLGGETLGVMTVNSREKELCGPSTQSQQVLADMLKPLAQLLAEVVVYSGFITTGDDDLEQTSKE
jgi:hypothetical protein